jgi:hypothetical protein
MRIAIRDPVRRAKLDEHASPFAMGRPEREAFLLPLGKRILAMQKSKSRKFLILDLALPCSA